ncbi:MAG: exodeoxyribonuclease VII large subunit [Lautropia sp.]|nr:exodeoxyribonuclease VII large subunit [Lautropia sp.]
MKQQQRLDTVWMDRDALPDVLTVGQLNRIAGRLLQAHFGVLCVTGELSNLTRAASGHWYFTLKEAEASVRAVMFRSAAQRVDFVPKEGDRVEVWARVGIYEARGDFQLGVERMQRAGLGDVWQRFARLKALLEQEGLFDPGLKQLIPPTVSTVGIISSLKAAALQDVLTTLARRAPQIRVIIYPAAVQGRQAPAELIAALDAAERRQECDVLLLVRGGGSFEDLDAFNDERLARRVAACVLPVVSGVGHESDVTICDFVADVRAPTPTAAAELVSPDRAARLVALSRLGIRLQQGMQRHLDHLGQRLDMSERLLRSPAQQMASQQMRLSRLAERLQQQGRWILQQQHQRWARAQQALTPPDTGAAAARLALMAQRLGQGMRERRQQAQNRLAMADNSLELISPLAVLARGYAIVRDAEGRVLRSAEAVPAGELLDIRLKAGALAARVEKVRTKA